MKDQLDFASSLRLEDLLDFSVDQTYHRKTKIICTLGPACWSEDMLVKMIDAGMDICRFNFSHGDHNSHQKCYDNLQKALSKRPNKLIGIMLDTKGPEIRTGFFKDGINEIVVEKGNEIKITVNYSTKGDEKLIACTYDKLPSSVEVGSKILIADGSLTLEVKEKHSDYVIAVALNKAKLGERKNMNLPGVKVMLPVCGEREINDIVNWGLPNGINYIAASFVQKPEDVLEIRKLLGEQGNHIKIIPKIENQEGLINFEEILKVSDGIMVARGDLGMEIPLEKMFLCQKWMIRKCNEYGKPVITATQMLESMINAPRPTRAEISDVANAVLDGTDCVMLSGESANGLFPLEAVGYLNAISIQAEKSMNNSQLQHILKNSPAYDQSFESLFCSVVQLAENVKAKAIIAYITNGESVRIISKFKPSQVIVAIGNDKKLLAGLLDKRAVHCVHLEGEGFDHSKAKIVLTDYMMFNKIAVKGDKVVILGVNADNPSLFQQIKVADL